jgi:hypothetical protein
MRKSIMVMGALLALSSVAFADEVFNTSLATPGFYNGSGNANSGFVANTTADGIEFGLGTQIRGAGGGPITPTPTDSATYLAPAGLDMAGTHALWNFEYSINLQAVAINSGLVLQDITPNVTILNEGNGQTYSFNPFTTTPDNSGYNGSVNAAFLNMATDYGFQNSENLNFAFLKLPLSFDATANDTYLFTLSAIDIGTGNSLGDVQETVVVGTGATPLPGALPLFAGGLGLVGLLAKRRKKFTPAI